MQKYIKIPFEPAKILRYFVKVVDMQVKQLIFKLENKAK